LKFFKELETDNARLSGVSTLLQCPRRKLPRTRSWLWRCPRWAGHWLDEQRFSAVVGL